MITVIDMELGNLGSVTGALRRAGAEVKVTSSADDVDRAGILLLPGVGAFGDGMESLKAKGLIEPLRRHAAAKKPLLGICLGMQLFADRSDEHGSHAGLGIISGSVKRLEPLSDERVPNMGWCDVTVLRKGALFPDLVSRSFYFAHSYYLECENPADIVGTIEYGGRSIAAAIEHDTILGVQFHPEKSQDAGMALINSFLKRK